LKQDQQLAGFKEKTTFLRARRSNGRRYHGEILAFSPYFGNRRPPKSAFPAADRGNACTGSAVGHRPNPVRFRFVATKLEDE
jgi:hypothetical protein